jgi:hypothetical protein
MFTILANDSPLWELLEIWQDDDFRPSPEELAGDRPELIEPIREAIRAMTPPNA